MTLTDGPHRERIENAVPTPTTEVGAIEVAASDRVGESSPPSSMSRVRTTSGSRFAPDALIAAAIGLVLGVAGLIAVIRGGFDGPMSAPVVKVLGFTHTTTLGMIEIGLGACLLISGAVRSRAGAMFFGGLLGVGGFVGAVQTSSFHTSLALEASMAWIAVIAGAVVVLAALLLPRFTRSTSTIR